MSRPPRAKESDIKRDFSKAPKHAPRDIGEIRSLQYGRGLAALLVCLFHYEGAKVQLQANFDGAADTNLHFIFGAGHSGVEFFFVLSGFIIFHAHRNDLSHPERFGTFYWKRGIRILPMFWFIVVPFGLAVLMLSSSGLLTPEKFLLDLLLIPREGTLTLPAAWTLQHEVVFYALFGLLILNTWLGFVALTLWQLACLIVLVFGLLPQDYLLPATTYWGYYNFGFVFGIAIALLRDRVDLRSYPKTFASLGVLGFFGLLQCFIGEWRMGAAFFASPATASLIYFFLYSLVMLALLSMVNKPRPILDATLGSLGAASYVLYVVHEPLYSVLERMIRIPILDAWAAPTPTFISFVIVAVLTALALHFAVERPMLRRLRGRLLFSPGSAKAITKV